MFLNKQIPAEKRGNSNKKVHRRVITELDEMPQQNHLQKQFKKTQRIITKPKYIDVYSKYMLKSGNQPKRQFKIGEGKPFTSDKHIKTQADEVIKTNTNSVHTQRPKPPASRFQIEGIAGKGTFGVVYFGIDRSTGERIAIKKVFQDKKYKNRQHTILKMLKHPNNLQMRQSFLTNEGEEQYLNIVMDYFQDNLYQSIKKKQISPILTKLYIYQIFRGLNYLSMLSIAHRDIKPQNILVDKFKHLIVISDFGSAKQLVKGTFIHIQGQSNLAYICSRCYRAPQLIFGATDYTPQIDMWSTGCVLVEMINGSPPFMGDSQIDQLIEIIKVLGTPTKTDVQEMNKAYDMKEYNKFPKIKANPWKNLLQTKDPLLIDLVTNVLQYSPAKRLTAAAALYHEYFNELRQEVKYHELLMKVKSIPNLFDYTQEQINFISETTKRKFELTPSWTTKKTVSLPITTKPTTATLQIKKPIISYKAI